MIGTFVGAFDFVTILWDDLPRIFEQIFQSVVNFAISAAEDVGNFFIEAYISIRDLVDLSDSEADRLRDALLLDFSESRYEIQQFSALFGTEIGDASEQFQRAFSVDYVGAATDAAGRALSGLSSAFQDNLDEVIASREGYR